MTMGRPTEYNSKIANRICDELVRGRTLRSILLTDEGMPDPVTVWRWRTRRADFDAALTAARAHGMEYAVDETQEIADDGTNDWMERTNRDGSTGWAINGEALGRSKLRIEQRFRAAEALAPHVYGKRQVIEHAGAIGVHLTKATDAELVAELLQLAASGKLKLAGVEFEAGSDGDEADDDFTSIIRPVVAAALTPEDEDDDESVA